MNLFIKGVNDFVDFSITERFDATVIVVSVWFFHFCFAEDAAEQRRNKKVDTFHTRSIYSAELIRLEPASLRGLDKVS